MSEERAIVTVRGASPEELAELAETLRAAGAETGEPVREAPGADLHFDPTLAAVLGYKLLTVVGPAAGKALADWIVRRLEARRAQPPEPGQPPPDLVVEVRGETITVSGTASPEAMRAALDAALGARE